MSHAYVAVGWNRSKRLYDVAIAAAIATSVAGFAAVTAIAHPRATVETTVIRGLAVTAFLMLHVILSIGPLCRLSPRFLPLLYNRRHLGVSMFLVALAHGAFATFQFHALGDVSPLVSLLGGDPGFQTLGVTALAILFLMAATSHDFWLANLTPPVWKTLHMGVYLAYALVIGHVTWGALRAESNPALLAATACGAAWIAGVHLAAGWRERRGDRESPRGPDGWTDGGEAATIPDGRARVVCAGGERVAVFRHGDRVSAVSNVCRHQNGPLGEGRILDGCITCPWHGYQYLPENGRSPAPFTEKVPTYDVRVAGGRVWVNPVPHPAGTPVAPARLEDVP